MILKVIEDRGWTLFDQNDENSLPEKHRAIYWGYVDGVGEGFESLKAKKEALGRTPKTSNNIGEIHCIALAQLISGNIISSNDFEIREVIKDQDMRVYSDELEEGVLIEQDTIEDFCVYSVQAEVAKPSSVVKFFKICHSGDFVQKLKNKVSVLKKRLNKLLE
ncbi:hypothetical protein [Lentibacillus sp. Marseille-P4043]|uniref:hypothetical protein n=1 Tax=Lentibacillus sp. Marseille-P4043 TaxID=2040293 RepID=UPI000D0B8121|nr:hypothetical protein [Lentibacillus sp. Marseille-P4043]